MTKADRKKQDFRSLLPVHAPDMHTLVNIWTHTHSITLSLGSNSTCENSPHRAHPSITRLSVELMAYLEELLQHPSDLFWVTLILSRESYFFSFQSRWLLLSAPFQPLLLSLLVSGCSGCKLLTLQIQAFPGFVNSNQIYVTYFILTLINFQLNCNKVNVFQIMQQHRPC